MPPRRQGWKQGRTISIGRTRFSSAATCGRGSPGSQLQMLRQRCCWRQDGCALHARLGWAVSRAVEGAGQGARAGAADALHAQAGVLHALKEAGVRGEGHEAAGHDEVAAQRPLLQGTG